MNLFNLKGKKYPNFFKQKLFSLMKVTLFLSFILCFNVLATTPLAALQQITITGTITDNEGVSIPGVNVMVQGTLTGTVTDVDGRYRINVPNTDAVLVFSFVGYTTQEVAVGNRIEINVTLLEGAQQLEEVVVTALGITREKKSLGYAVAEVKGDVLQRVAQENVLNSLSGKVPGVAISQTGVTGSSVSMVIRGASSLTSDNQPLFVVDGIPMKNTLNNISQFGNNNIPDFGNAISDLNADDIESISVLKGPSAAALYGGRAGNGVVLITTKSGKKSKGLGVSVTSNTVFEKPYKFLDKQTGFANGARPYTQDNRPNNNLDYMIINPYSAAWAGPELDKGIRAYVWPYFDENGNLTARELKSHPDNAKNFFEWGITSTNNVSIENANDRVDYRVSYTNMQNKGVIPNTDLQRHTFSVNNSVKLIDQLTISSNMNYTSSSAKNRPSGNNGANAMQAMYETNPSIDIRALKDYWKEVNVRQNSPYQLAQTGGEWGSHATNWLNNPYFLSYELKNGFKRERVFGNVKADWQIFSDLSLMIRYSHDQFNEKRESKIAQSFTGEKKGYYGVVDIFTREQNADFLLAYNKRISDFSLNISFGGNLMKQIATDHTTKFKNGGTGMVIPGLYRINNTVPTNIDYSTYLSEKKVRSLYGMGSFGYKDFVYLDLTARNDWSSTLYKGYNSYFYPSASLSVLANNIFDMGKDISLLKLRYGWARVGNDTEPYNLMASMGDSRWGDLLTVSMPSAMYNRYLKPEINTSWEIGADLAMFQNKLRFEGTYYQGKNTNQIFQVDISPSSGYGSQFINAGLLSSKGIELSLGGTPVESKDWVWDINFVFSRNRVKVEELAPGMKYVNFWEQGNIVTRTWIGQEIGQMIDNTLVRVNDPTSKYDKWPLLDDEGYYEAKNNRSEKDLATVVGNFNPDFTLGIQTSVSYKRWTLSASLDWRKGGQFFSQTYRYGESDMHTNRWMDRLINISHMSEQERVNYILANEDKYLKPGGAFYALVGGPTKEMGGFQREGDDNVTLYDGVYALGVRGHYDSNDKFVLDDENIGADLGTGTLLTEYSDTYGWDFGRTAIFDADFLKLRDISLTYQFPSAWFASIGIRNASISIYSRNIILWTKAKINIDPEMAFQPESSKQGASGIMFRQGIERYNVAPWVIPIGIKLNVSF